VFLSQPDFTASEEVQYSRQTIKELDGLTISYAASKRGSEYRRDRSVVVSYELPSEPALLFYPRSREYIESPRLGVWVENANSPGLLAAHHAEDLVFDTLDDAEVDGNTCRRVEVTHRGDASDRIIYFVATGLRNLVVKSEVVTLLGTQTYTLKDISFEVSSDLFRKPVGFKRALADPTAEYTLIDLFRLDQSASITPESVRAAIKETLPLGSPEPEVYRYLEDRGIGKNRLTTYYRAGSEGRIVCRLEYDTTLPHVVKKHFAIVFQLDDQRRLKDIRLNSRVIGP
jgi:hypothetical protein